MSSCYFIRELHKNAASADVVSFPKKVPVQQLQLFRATRLVRQIFFQARHPVGQAFAAWEAGRLNLQLPGAVGVSGLQTHHLFEPDAFSEMLGNWSPSFSVPGGTGIGFDDLLGALPWTRLY